MDDASGQALDENVPPLLGPQQFGSLNDGLETTNLNVDTENVQGIGEYWDGGIMVNHFENMSSPTTDEYSRATLMPDMVPAVQWMSMCDVELGRKEASWSGGGKDECENQIRSWSRKALAKLTRIDRVQHPPECTGWNVGDH